MSRATPPAANPERDELCEALRGLADFAQKHQLGVEPTLRFIDLIVAGYRQKTPASAASPSLSETAPA